MTSYELQQRKQARETTERVQKAFEELSRACNVMGQERVVQEAICQAMCMEHRTIQQTLVGVLVGGLYQYGEKERTDLRNEAAVKLCKELKEVLDRNPLPYI